MKKLAVLSAALAIGSLLIPALLANPAGSEAKAQALVDALAKGDFKAASKDFDATMSSGLPPDKLEQAWTMILTQAGAYKGRGATWTVPQAGFEVVFVECHFERASVDAKVAYDFQKKVAGLYFVPAQPPPNQGGSQAPAPAPSQGSAQAPAPSPAQSPAPKLAPAAETAPAYAKQDAFVEKDVQVGSGDWVLPGKLDLPKGAGPFPAVVLVHGSGPEDMDESVGGAKVFKDLGQGLASAGIAVLRYDKRTKVYTLKMAADQSTLTVRDEVLTDVYAALALLRRTDGVDPKRVFVLGHSLGGMLAPRIAMADRKLAGIVIMAGSTRPLEDLIVEQMDYIASLQPGGKSDPKIEAIKKQAAKVKDPQLSSATPSSELPFNTPASYWLDLRAYNPAKMAGGLEIPILVLQGGRDYQVSTKDFDGWKSALDGHPNATFKLYPSLNHLFEEGEGKSTPAEYEKPGHVAAPVVKDIASWILSLPH